MFDRVVDERQAQRIEGARMAAQEDNFVVRTFPTPPQFRQRALSRAKSGRATAKPQVVGHEAFLKALENSGAPIEIWLESGVDCFIGKIKHSDKFTISLEARTRIEEGVAREMNGQTVVVFKHSIAYFIPLRRDEGSAIQKENQEEAAEE